MNTKKLILSALVGVLFLVACKDGNKQPAAIPGLGPAMEVSAYDTTTVMQMTAEYLDLVKAGDIDAAMTRLYILDENDQVRPLPDDQKQQCRFSLEAFKVYQYKITGFIFYKETDSEVKYALTVQDPATNENPAVINGLIRPVRRDGRWYITLANTQTEAKPSELNF